MFLIRRNQHNQACYESGGCCLEKARPSPRCPLVRAPGGEPRSVREVGGTDQQAVAAVQLQFWPGGQFAAGLVQRTRRILTAEILIRGVHTNILLLSCSPAAGRRRARARPPPCRPACRTACLRPPAETAAAASSIVQNCALPPVSNEH